ncbi:LysR substrate-binding domain-containing protein [Teredinibacter turnerae]|uniref:LysR substrate-binding domain-containing protein n=1 Tax=Teredinibacter turnerae TaxID=2426 RepID=UPI0005F79162
MVLFHFYMNIIHMIDRMHLRIMREIDAQGSLTRAAHSLHLTQSALSHAVKKLEQQLCVSLWIKQGRQLQLTAAGRHLLLEAQRLLPQLERLDDTMADFAQGNRGSLRIGMECHPCYRWLLTIVEPFLTQWPGVDVDVKQQFQFGGMAALFNYDIDILVTPDPLARSGVEFHPCFAYEQVLVVSSQDSLANEEWIAPNALSDKVLYTYPVEPSRLDIYTEFLLPGQCQPRKHKVIEATEMMLQLVAARRGVACLPLWLVEQMRGELAITTVRLGQQGVHKHIHLGVRQEAETANPFIASFLDSAR